MVRYRWMLASAILWLGACGARSGATPPRTAPAAQLDVAKVESVVEQQTRQGVQSASSGSAVSRAFGQAFDQLVEDPAVSRAGAELFERLGKDPEVGRAAKAILQELTTSEEFHALVERLRAEHPNDFEQELARRTGGATESKQVDAAISKAMDELMQRPSVERADNGRLPAIVGVARGDERFEEALGNYLNEPSRIERVLVGYAGVFGRHPAPRRAIAEILRSPALYQATLRPVRALLVDRDFVQRSNHAITAILDGAPQSELNARARDALTSRAAERAMVSWISSIQAVADLPPKLARAFESVAESPEFARTIEDVYFGDRKTAFVVSQLARSGATSNVRIAAFLESASRRQGTPGTPRFFGSGANHFVAVSLDDV